MGDVGKGRWTWGVTFWSENVRCLTLWAAAGLPPSGVAPACPRCTRGVSKGRLGPVIPRDLGPCVTVRQTGVQGWAGVWPGVWPGVAGRDQGETGWHPGPHAASQTSPGLTQLAIVREQPGQRSRVAIHPTAEKQMTTSVLALVLAALLLPVLVLLWATESTEGRARRLSRSGWSQRRIAEHLGVTRYRVRLALA